MSKRDGGKSHQSGTGPVSKRKAKEALGKRFGSFKKAKDFLEKYKTEREQLLRDRRQKLEDDPLFYDENRKLLAEVRTAHRKSPRQVAAFFNQFKSPIVLRNSEALAFIDSAPFTIRPLLRRYLRHSSRFQVYFRWHKGILNWNVVLPTERKLAALQLAGRLVPRSSTPPDAVSVEDFASPAMDVPPELQALTDAGDARYFEIEDVSGVSILNEIESLSYLDDGIALIMHKAERPYLFLLIGEKANRAKIDDIAKAVTQFQKEHYSRGRAGRPPDMKRRKKADALLELPGPKKEKAYEITTAQRLESGQSYLSRRRKKLAD